MSQTWQLPRLPHSFDNNQLANTGGNNANQSYGTNEIANREHDNPKKASYAVQMMRDSKLNGDIRKDTKETIKLYEICIRQYMLTERQRSEFFIHAFEGSARRFSLEKTSPTVPFGTMDDIMIAEYDSDARKIYVKATLELVRLRSFMRENGTQDVTDGLTKLVEHINELAPQCPMRFQKDASKTDYLRRAVAEFQDWAKIPISNINSQNLTVNSFATALHEFIQNLKQLSQLSGRFFHIWASSLATRKTVDTRMMRYDLKPRHVHWKDGKGHRRTTKAVAVSRYSAKTLQEARRRSECIRCGEPWSKEHKCAEYAARQYTENCMRFY